ncbi:MAG: DUF1287 domain-containing protein [Cyclobacteriaceae bacterium]
MKTFPGIVFLIFLAASAPFAQDSFPSKLSKAAVELTGDHVSYDPSYYSIEYPNGDVPADKGVCTDVIIRAYRKLGIDLQKEVHEDMLKDFKNYPQLWGLTKTDTNIDHRRVPNLMYFFGKHGKTKSITSNATDYAPGDIVAWNLGGSVTHIGLVIDRKSEDGERNLIVHNIGNGQEISDCLFRFKIIGHYTYQK